MDKPLQEEAYYSDPIGIRRLRIGNVRALPLELSIPFAHNLRFTLIQIDVAKLALERDTPNPEDPNR